jgi:Fe-S-cluster containining protein
MITDLVQIRRAGEKMRPENERFRKHLKVHDFNALKLRKIAEGIENHIDCRQCASCCRVATVTLQERDVAKLAKYLRTSISKFVAEYTEESEEEGLILRRSETGCVFLSGNDCIVYDARPSMCEGFPHLVRGAGSLPSRMWQMIDRACYCPIVFNTLEAYKEECGFRR